MDMGALFRVYLYLITIAISAKMNIAVVLAGEDLAEQIKWWDARDILPQRRVVEDALQLARECRHPDAQWLASLFPAGVAVSPRDMMDTMLEQGDDPRALHILWKLGHSAETTCWRSWSVRPRQATALLRPICPCTCRTRKSSSGP
jgi:hypothetical protein